MNLGGARSSFRKMRELIDDEDSSGNRVRVIPEDVLKKCPASGTTVRSATNHDPPSFSRGTKPRSTAPASSLFARPNLPRSSTSPGVVKDSDERKGMKLSRSQSNLQSSAVGLDQKNSRSQGDLVGVVGHKLSLPKSGKFATLKASNPQIAAKFQKIFSSSSISFSLKARKSVLTESTFQPPPKGSESKKPTDSTDNSEKADGNRKSVKKEMYKTISGKASERALKAVPNGSLRGQRGTLNSQLCGICGFGVTAEMIIVQTFIFHATCFKCYRCDMPLTGNNCKLRTS